LVLFDFWIVLLFGGFGLLEVAMILVSFLVLLIRERTLFIDYFVLRFYSLKNAILFILFA